MNGHLAAPLAIPEGVVAAVIEVAVSPEYSAVAEHGNAGGFSALAVTHLNLERVETVDDRAVVASAWLSLFGWHHPTPATPASPSLRYVSLEIRKPGRRAGIRGRAPVAPR